jgi:regulator of protease activity HflC (stomatin/prohibitin superfamily)
MGTRFARLITAASVLALLSACTASTGATEVGVRTHKLGLLGERGVEDDIYLQGGTYFFFRPSSEFATYDVGVQNLTMLRENNDAVRFKTVDGNDVWVDVTVSWAIDASMAPYVLQFVGHSTPELEAKLVRPVARAVVRDVLNQLTSEEYYQSDRRFQAAEQAQDRLNAVLGNEGVRVDQILLGEHKFNDTYEQLIRDKKVAEQEAERLVSETEAEVEGKRRELQQLSGEIEQAKQLATGEAEKRKRDADAIRFEKEREADAIRREAEARSQGLREKAAAMSGTGGENMVKLKVAEALNGKKILFVPAGSGLDVRQTDMNKLLQLYGLAGVTK